jgi:hypothetical protein
LKSATGSYIERRPDTVHHHISLGGPLAVRSAAKSALVLWATGVGNEEVSSAPYADARHFIMNGNEAFNRGRTHLDSRYLPQSDELQHRLPHLRRQVCLLLRNQLFRHLANVREIEMVLARDRDVAVAIAPQRSRLFRRQWSFFRALR